MTELDHTRPRPARVRSTAWAVSVVLCLATFPVLLLAPSRAAGAAGAATAIGAEGGDSGIVESAHPVAGRYLVTLEGVPRAEVRETATDLAEQHDGDVDHVYRNALRGFSVEMSEQDAIALSAEPEVVRVEEDSLVRVDEVQQSPPWGLDRLDQTALPLSGTYEYEGTGAGVTAYVVDTGIRVTHQDFGGRARLGTSTVEGTAADCHGHGTHVAGTIGGRTYGVAKDVDLVAVRVLGCDGRGPVSGVVAGIDWVTADHRAHPGPAVANMSLGGAASASLDAAVSASIASGVTFVVAAGNAGSDACRFSPARAPGAVTVGATDDTDARAPFSNVGPCVDLFAPGVGVRSALHDDDTASGTKNGTSMAAPHAAGVAARHLERHPSASPATVHEALVDRALSGRVSGAGSGTPNRLLYGGYLRGAPSLTVQLDAVPSIGTDVTFDYCPPGGGGCHPFTLDDDQDPTLASWSAGGPFAPGAYTVTQRPLPGWRTTIDCDSEAEIDPTSRRIRVDLAAGEHVTCTFRVSSSAITLVHDGVPDHGTDVGYTGCQGAACGTFSLDDDSDPVLARSVTAGGLAPGTYTLTQAAVPGWELQSLVCDTGEAVDLTARRATISLAEGEHVTCTFTLATSAITIVQDDVSDSGTDFTFRGCDGLRRCQTFTLDDDAGSDPALPDRRTFVALTADRYTVTQEGPLDRPLEDLECDGRIDADDRQAIIDLVVGQRIVCRFVNRDPAPPNDSFAAARALDGMAGRLVQSTVGATAEPGEPAHAGSPAGASVWFRWTAPSSGWATFSTCDVAGTDFDTVLGIYRGDSVAALVEVDSNDDRLSDGRCGNRSLVEAPVEAGVTYRIAVDGFGGSSGTTTLWWETT